MSGGRGADRYPGANEALDADDLTVLPGAVDHHVHLGLVDRTLLADGPLVHVIDCGWDPEVALAWRASPPSGVSVRVAGPFHTAVGGYPAGREWAPRGAVREIADRQCVHDAVRIAVEARYDAFKIALHDEMGLLDDDLLQDLIDGAHCQGLPVYVHAEGAGQAMRAVRGGADVLVHAPFSETLSDSELSECVRADVSWVSTLAIHAGQDLARAIDNVRRFRLVGGTVRYGTDMGNGESPVGVSAPELRALAAAGFRGQALLDTILVGEARLESVLPAPQTAVELIDWLGACQRSSLDVEDEEEWS